MKCPYCKEPLNMGAKICRSCRSSIEWKHYNFIAYLIVSVIIAMFTGGIGLALILVWPFLRHPVK
jgi:hypothetical protein